MVIAYPASLPCFLRDGIFSPRENLFSSPRMDGIVKNRRLYPNPPPVIHNVSLRLTADQLRQWEIFVKDTLQFTKSFTAPLVTASNAANPRDADGKPQPQPEVTLLSSAYSVRAITQGSYLVSNIKLIEVA